MSTLWKIWASLIAVLGGVCFGAWVYGTARYPVVLMADAPNYGFFWVVAVSLVALFFTILVGGIVAIWSA